MKRSQIVFAFALIGMIIFAGCEKSEKTTSKYNMRVDIAGKATYLGNCFVNLSYNPAGANNYVIEAVPDSAGFPIVLIAVPYVSQGVYNIGSPSTSCYAKYFADVDYINPKTNKAADTAFVRTAASGILVIGSTEPFVTGTFSFTCTDGTTLSTGIFTAKPAN